MKHKPYRKPGGPSETLDKLRKGKSILVDRVTANRLRATASQRAIPYKSRTEGDLVRITKLYQQPKHNMNIEKSIPIPPKLKPGGPAETLDLMRAGDSVLVNDRKSRSIREEARRKGILVTGRKEGDKIRVWRVS